MFFFLWRVMQRKPSLGKPDQKDLNENLAATQGLAHMIAECKKLFQVKHLCKTNGCSIGRYGLGLPYNGKLQMSLYFKKDQYVINNLLKNFASWSECMHEFEGVPGELFCWHGCSIGTRQLRGPGHFCYMKASFEPCLPVLIVWPWGSVSFSSNYKAQSYFQECQCLLYI